MQRSVEVTIQGKVLNSTGRPVGDASLRLEREGVPVRLETKTNADGVFVFSAPGTGRYFLIAEKSGLSSRTISVVVSSLGEHKQVDVVLEDSQEVHTDSTASVPPSTQAMEFADKPSFTVAGVTDGTAAGGHGADTSLRTSEALTHETLALKANGVAHFAADSTSAAK